MRDFHGWERQDAPVVGEGVRVAPKSRRIKESANSKGGSVGIIIQSYIGAERDAHDQYMTWILGMHNVWVFNAIIFINIKLPPQFK